MPSWKVFFAKWQDSKLLTTADFAPWPSDDEWICPFLSIASHGVLQMGKEKPSHFVEEMRKGRCLETLSFNCDLWNDVISWIHCRYSPRERLALQRPSSIPQHCSKVAQALNAAVKRMLSTSTSSTAPRFMVLGLGFKLMDFCYPPGNESMSHHWNIICPWF